MKNKPRKKKWVTNQEIMADIEPIKKKGYYSYHKKKTEKV